MNATTEITTDTLIIGAGLTGLTTAHYLAKANKSFLILEAAKHTGGVIQSKSEDGFLYEQGPNTGVIGNETVVELFEGLEDTLELQLGGKNVKKRYILKEGKWNALPMGLMDAIRTPLFTWKDKFRILGEPFRKAGKDPHENLAHFVERRLGKSMFQYAIDPFIIGVYAGDPHYLIPKYALPKLYNLEQEYGSLIGGSIRKGFQKKTPEQKKVSKKVFSFKGGLASLTQALTNSVGSENIHLDSTDIVVASHKDGFVVSYTKQGEKYSIQSRNIISTTGAYTLPELMPFISSADLEKISSLHYTKVIQLAIGFKHWEGIPLDGFGGLIPSVEKRDILGILYMSSLFAERAPEGGALLSIFMGGVRRQDLIALSDEEIHKIAERECKDLLSLSSFSPDLFKIIRYEHAIPQYGIESGERFETITKLGKQYPGLHIGGNLSNGIGMADRIQQGKCLAEKVILGAN